MSVSHVVHVGPAAECLLSGVDNWQGVPDVAAVRRDGRQVCGDGAEAMIAVHDDQRPRRLGGMVLLQGLSQAAHQQRHIRYERLLRQGVVKQGPCQVQRTNRTTSLQGRALKPNP